MYIKRNQFLKGNVKRNARRSHNIINVGKSVVKFDMMREIIAVLNDEIKKRLRRVPIEGLSDVHVKVKAGHAVKSAPVRPGKSARVIANNVKNIVRKLHGVEKLNQRRKDSIL